MLLLALVGACALVWHNGRTAHEKVLAVSRTVCADLRVQRLDDTVALRRIGVAWTRDGPVLRRVYRFEFSTDGVARNSGEIALVGLRLDWVRVDHPDGNYFIDVP